MTAKEFLIREVPGLTDITIEEIKTFGGGFLLYAMEKYAEEKVTEAINNNRTADND